MPDTNVLIYDDGKQKPSIFSWENVSFSVPFKKETKQLLYSVNGVVSAGQVIAIMLYKTKIGAEVERENQRF
jgi:hypothetical protein